MTKVWRAVAAFLAAAGAALGGGSPTAPGGPASAPSGPAPATGFEWPLHPEPAVLRPFEAPPHPWSPGHRGVDLAAAVGQPVFAAGPGTVSFSGVIAGRGVIAIQHADGRRTTYEPVADRDPRGTAETRGARIGTVAAGTHCGPRPCLHWGLLVGPDDYRDPLSLLEFRPVRLLPLG